MSYSSSKGQYKLRTDIAGSLTIPLARSNTSDDHDEHAIGRGDHDGEEEVARLALHGTSGSPERRREGDGSTYEENVYMALPNNHATDHLVIAPYKMRDLNRGLGGLAGGRSAAKVAN